MDVRYIPEAELQNFYGETVSFDTERVKGYQTNIFFYFSLLHCGDLLHLVLSYRASDESSFLTKMFS